MTDAAQDQTPCHAGVIGAAAFMLLFSACMPQIMHGPRVEDDGLSGSLSLTVGRNREIGELQPRILPSMYAGLRRSWVPAGGRGAAGSIGFQVPVLLAPLIADGDRNGLEALAATSYADIYLQPSRSGEPGFETGVGVLASTALGGPYVQAGMMRPGGKGWYTTQLLAFAIGDDLGSGVLYFPSVVWRHRDTGAETAANVSAGLGLGLGDSDMGTLIVLGVALELGLGRH